MRYDVNIGGMGSVHKGEYDKVSIDGMGKIKGPIKSNSVSIDGMAKIKGKILTGEFTCDGMVRSFRSIKAKKVTIDGLLKLRRASLEADSIVCDGLLTCTNEVSADEIKLNGLCSIRRLYGENIEINSGSKEINISMPIKLNWFNKLYFGRNLNNQRSIVDVIECTNLEATGLVAKVIRADHVKLGEYCVVDILDCNGNVEIHPTSIVRKRKNK